MGGTNEPYTVIVSDRAKDMLVQHVRFVARINLQAADKLRTEIIEAVKSLESFPERNSWLSDPVLLENKYREMIISRRYSLIYQIKDNVVFIDYILDYRQDYKWLL